MNRMLIQLLLCAYLAQPVYAQEMKNPLEYPLKQYGFMLAVAVFGGLVSWYAKVRKGEVSAWAISQLIGEVATSAFAGLLCFWVCTATGISLSWTVPLVGIAGHMGTRAIQAIEAYAQKKFPIPGKGDEPHT